MSAAMNAIGHNGHGGSGAMRMVRRPVPGGEALIRIGADRRQSSRHSPARRQLPTLDRREWLEVAGTVVANDPGNGGPEVAPG